MIDFKPVRPAHDVEPVAVQITHENIAELAAHLNVDVSRFNERPFLVIPAERSLSLSNHAYVEDWIVYRPGETRDIEVIPWNKFERAYRLTSAASQLDEAVRAEVEDCTAYIVIAEHPTGLQALFSEDMTPAHAVGIAHVFTIRGATR